MIQLQDLYSEEDPLELFRLSSRAIAEYQDAIDSFAEVRARAVAALYSQGYTYKSLGELLGMSAPRVGQIISSNDAAAIEVLKSWHSIERHFTDIVGTLSPGKHANAYTDALRIMRASETFDKDAFRALEEIRQARNKIVHGRIDVSTDEAEQLADKAIYVNACIVVWLMRESNRRSNNENLRHDG